MMKKDFIGMDHEMRVQSTDIWITLRELDAIRSSKRIEAIRLIRERTRLGIRESKEIVDLIEDLFGLAEYEPCSSCGGTGKKRRFT